MAQCITTDTITGRNLLLIQTEAQTSRMICPTQQVLFICQIIPLKRALTIQPRELEEVKPTAQGPMDG